MRSLRSALFFLCTLLLGACIDIGPTDAGNSPSGTLLTAKVNDRQFVVSPGDDPRNRFYVNTKDGEQFVQLIAYRKRGAQGEGVHIWLDGFKGVGAYVVTDEMVIGGAMAGYWTDAPFQGQSGFFVRGPGDTVWVSSYDAETGEIHGEFKLHGSEPGGDTVWVTEGRFQGTIDPDAAVVSWPAPSYVGSAGAVARRIGIP
jgi:hypothetical protein